MDPLFLTESASFNGLDPESPKVTANVSVYDHSFGLPDAFSA